MIDWLIDLLIDCLSVQVVFDGPVYHPHIDPVTHQLNVKQGFHKWKRTVNHIWQLLLYTRGVFYKIEVSNPDLGKNKDAALLWEKDLEKFQSEAQQRVKNWEKELYSHDNPDLWLPQLRRPSQPPVFRVGLVTLMLVLKILILSGSVSLTLLYMRRHSWTWMRLMEVPVSSVSGVFRM